MSSYSLRIRLSRGLPNISLYMYQSEDSLSRLCPILFVNEVWSLLQHETGAPPLESSENFPARFGPSFDLIESRPSVTWLPRTCGGRTRAQRRDEPEGMALQSRRHPFRYGEQNPITGANISGIRGHPKAKNGSALEFLVPEKTSLITKGPM